MAKVDAQRSIYIPKELAFKADNAIIVPFGTSFLLIPVPEKVIEIDIKASIQELKQKAEEKGKDEATLKKEDHLKKAATAIINAVENGKLTPVQASTLSAKVPDHTI